MPLLNVNVGVLGHVDCGKTSLGELTAAGITAQTHILLFGFCLTLGGMTSATHILPRHHMWFKEGACAVALQLLLFPPLCRQQR